MQTFHNVQITLSETGRGRTRKRTGFRALVKATDEAGPFGVVCYRTVNDRIVEESAEVLPGCYDDLGEACEAAKQLVLARKRAGS